MSAHDIKRPVKTISCHADLSLLNYEVGDLIYVKDSDTMMEALDPKGLFAHVDVQRDIDQEYAEDDAKPDDSVHPTSLASMESLLKAGVKVRLM